MSIVVTASREDLRTLKAAVTSLLKATPPNALVDIVVNGNLSLADEFSRLAPGIPKAAQNKLRVWRLGLGDKAHALNQYIHHIWPGGSLLFMIDGYVSPNEDSLWLLRSGMQNAPNALGGSGVPAVGWSAKRLSRQMVKHGGIHGNFCCIRGDIVDELKRREFRLPLGLYRVDSTLGAILSFALNPADNDWDPRRIHVQPDASWSIPKKYWWRPADFISYWRRIERQAQGRLENLAVEYHLKTRKLAPELLPRTVRELVFDWIHEEPEAAKNVLQKSILCRRAVARLRETRDWSLADAPPIELASV